MKNPAIKTICALVSLTSILLFPIEVFAFGSSSTSFKLEGDFGLFGGSKSSANYRLSDTGGGFAVGFGNSNNFRNCSGFQCTIAQVPTITFTMSSNTVNLGSLTVGSVSTDSHTITVKTNDGPYIVTVLADGKLRYASVDIDDVGDGAVTAGSEEYGLSTSDTDSGLAFPTDSDCAGSTYNATAPSTSSPQIIAKALGPTQFLNPTTPPAGETTTICYMASKAGNTPAGQYIQTITFSVTGTF